MRRDGDIRSAFSFPLKILRNYPLLYLHFNEQWFKDIMRCQNEIADWNSSYYYKFYQRQVNYNFYRRQEIFYWSNIPKWIREDWTSHPAKRCLDVGCMYGTLTLYCKKLLNCEVYCIDFIKRLSPQFIEKYNIVFNISDIETDPFPWDLSFDIIIFTEVLEHLNFHPLPTLRLFSNILSKNGRLYLSTPDASEWGKATKYYSSLNAIPYPRKGTKIIDDHVYVYSKDELLDVIKDAGLRVCRFGYSSGLAKRHFNMTLAKK